jgi:hypothetical protein
VSQTFAFSVDMASFDAMLDGQSVKLEAAARPAAQAAAEVLYQATKANVAKLGRKTGNLASAIYQAFSASNSGPGRATYHVSWNAKKAPHGHLVEWGYLQRYKMYKGGDGKIRPMVRPGMEGQPRPRRSSPQSAKDAYYVPRPGGPLRIPGKAFLRGAWSQREAALAAAKARLMEAIAA